MPPRNSPIATLVVGFVYFPLLARLDGYVARSPYAAGLRVIAARTVELIDGMPYRPGTWEVVQSARAEFLHVAGAANERFRREVDAAFRRLEDEAVAEYLDWYYSLPAEYGRLGMMLQGQLEEYLTEKARQTFAQDKWYRSVEAVYETMLSVNEEAREVYERKVRDVLDENRVQPEHPEDTAFDVTLTASLEGIIQPSLHRDVIPVTQRLGAAGVAAGAGSAAAGGISFIIVQKLTAKVLGKQVLKLAAKAPLKAAAGKLAAAVAGGAAIGSVVPGAGTPVGALVGGALVGAGLGVAVDGALLELEEALSREDFERELVAAIREARDEFADDYVRRPPAG